MLLTLPRPMDLFPQDIDLPFQLLLMHRCIAQLFPQGGQSLVCLLHPLLHPSIFCLTVRIGVIGFLQIVFHDLYFFFQGL